MMTLNDIMREESALMTERIRAEAIARVAHYGQLTLSDGELYHTHLAAVAANVDHDLKAAAWLHDLLEDTPIRAEQLLAAGISVDTVATVQAVTRRDGETYDGYIQRLALHGSHAAITLKLADLRHNLRPSCPPALARRYRAAVIVLRTVVIPSGQWEEYDAAFQGLTP